MHHHNSNQASGTTGAPQTSLENEEYEGQVKENEQNITKQFADYPKQIHEGKQGKHIPGHNNYKPGKSKITIPLHELQKLIYEKSGTGYPISPNKEGINFDKIIGVYVDPQTKEEIPTTIGIIHYSKTGVHVVPARPEGDY